MGVKEGEWLYMKEVKCPTCGKMFFPAAQHALVDDRGAYCKPTCFLKRSTPKPRYERRKIKRVIQLDDDGQIIGVYTSANDVAENVTRACASTVRNACRLGRKYKGYWWRYED